MPGRIELRQSTARVVRVGPFFDDTDGKTPETGLTVGSIDIDLYKAGATGVSTSITATASGGDNDMVHIANGYYSFELTAGNTDTLGEGEITFNVAGALAQKLEFVVVTQNYWDSKYSTDRLQVDVVESSTPVAVASVSGAVGSVTGNVGGNVVGSVGSVSGAVGSVTAGVTLAAVTHTGATIPTVTSVTNAVTVTGTPAVNVTQFGGSAGTFSGGRPEVNTTHWGGTAVGSANVRANVVQVAGQTASASAGVTFPSSIGTGTSTLDAAGVRSAVGLASANLDTQLAAIDDAVDTEVAAIKATTDKLDTALELDGSVYRFTANALEQAPSGGGGGATAEEVWTYATRVLTANTNLNDPTAAAVATAVRSELTTELGRIDVAISTRLASASYTAPDNAGIAAILDDTGTTGVVVAAGSKAGYSLASTGLDAITPAEPSAVPTWGSSSIVAWLGWLAAPATNEVEQAATTQTLRNYADSASIATAAVSDNGTTFTRGRWNNV